MDEKLSKNTAQRLLSAGSSEDVANILLDEDLRYYFDQPENWRPYGGRDKNWDTVGNQQSSPVGALTELITNGIDAILLRKAKEHGITDFRSPEAPQSMFEAVKRFFPQVVDGKISNLSPRQRTDLAEKCLLVGVKRAARVNSIYPTYTLVDIGEGQKPEDFPKTFLSLSEKNKEGISFVQGKFNMGSTGSLRFCTRSDIRLGHYKLIISKRPDNDYWGWTLIRVRGAKAGEQLPVAEYFTPGGIPRFRGAVLSAFGHDTLGQVESCSRANSTICSESSGNAASTNFSRSTFFSSRLTCSASDRRKNTSHGCQFGASVRIVPWVWRSQARGTPRIRSGRKFNSISSRYQNKNPPARGELFQFGR